MPPRLPAPFIHLLGVLRPRLLRPDVRAASIAHVDWAGLRRAGWNAVVVDKDNCVTLPHSDEVYGPYTSAWAALRRTFPGRVLMVSNSAGSAKDRGGIGAEALSLSLGVPVLAHAHAKPACAPDVAAYFSGRLGLPRLTRSLALAPVVAAAATQDAAEAELVDQWRAEVARGPLCGRLQLPQRDDGGLEARMVAAQAAPPGAEPAATVESAPVVAEERVEERQALKAADETLGEADEDDFDALELAEIADAGPDGVPAKLRVLVVGDRLFTDVLLARRLDGTSGAGCGADALAVETTQLPQPNDMKLVRRFEEWLSGGKLSGNGTKYERYIHVDAVPPPAPRLTLAERAGAVALAPLAPLRRRWASFVAKADAQAQGMTLDPRSWRARPVAVAILRFAARGARAATALLGKYTRRAAVILARYTRRGGRGAWEWTKTQVANARERRAARAAANAKAPATPEPALTSPTTPRPSSPPS